MPKSFHKPPAFHKFDKRLSEVRPFFPGRPSTSSLNRYCATGATNRTTGEKVILESVFAGGVRYTSKAAVLEFLRQLNPPTHAEAEAELIEDGC